MTLQCWLATGHEPPARTPSGSIVGDTGCINQLAAAAIAFEDGVTLGFDRSLTKIDNRFIIDCDSNSRNTEDERV